jgi:hypothetical protein
MKIALTIPGMGKPIDSGLPVPIEGPNITVQSIIITFLNLLMVIAILFCLYQIIIGGMAISIGRGNKEALKRGMDKVVFAILGLIFIFMAIFVINALGDFAGFNLLPFLSK